MSNAFDYSYFDGYDQEYKPEHAGLKPNIEVLEDGKNYEFEVLSAAPDTIQGKGVVRLTLQVDGALEIEHIYWLDTLPKMKSFGADLVLLGFDRFRQPGLSIKSALPDAIAKLPGIRYRVYKTSNEGTGQYEGRRFHNLRILSRTTGTPMPPTFTPGFDETAGDSSSSAKDIPF